MQRPCGRRKHRAVEELQEAVQWKHRTKRMVVKGEVGRPQTILVP